MIGGAGGSGLSNLIVTWLKGNRVRLFEHRACK